MEIKDLCIHLTINAPSTDNAVNYGYFNAKDFYEKAMKLYKHEFTLEKAGTLLLGQNWKVKVKARTGHVYISIKEIEKEKLK